MPTTPYRNLSTERLLRHICHRLFFLCWENDRHDLVDAVAMIEKLAVQRVGGLGEDDRKTIRQQFREMLAGDSAQTDLAADLEVYFAGQRALAAMPAMGVA